MSECTIWHNPRCSKSRQSLALLRERGLEPIIVEYLKTPPSITDIKKVLALLGLEPSELMRRGEKIFKELQLAQVTDDEALISAMHENPILIERPIIFQSGKAAIGRPPENVLSIL